jgi:hypothetical protein
MKDFYMKYEELMMKWYRRIIYLGDYYLEYDKIYKMDRINI